MTRSPLLSSPRARRMAGASAAAIVWSLATAAYALPTNPVVVGTTGADVNTAAGFGTVGNTLTVTQNDDRVVIDWDSFNIGSTEAVQFNQPNAGSIAFNRVDPTSFSTIAGDLSGNGGVWIFSPGGLLIGNGANVNVGSFVGSTAQLLDANLAAALASDTISLSALAARNGQALTVEAGASITANDGFVVLLGETIVQNGQITSDTDAVFFGVAEQGQVSIETGEGGASLTNVTVSAVAGRGRPSFTQGGAASAETWFGLATPGAVESGWQTVINLGGSVQALGVRYGTEQGVVILTGSGGVVDNTAGDVQLNATGSTITATNDVYIAVGGASIGNVVGDRIDIDVVDLVDVVGAVSGYYIDINAGTLEVHGSLDASIVYGAADNITVFDGATVDGGSGGGFRVRLNADDNLTIQGGASVTAYGDVSLSTGSNYGLLSVGGYVYGDDVEIAGGGDVTVSGQVTAYSEVAIRSYYGDSGGFGDILISGDISAGQGISIRNDNVGEVRLASGGSLTTDYEGCGPFCLATTPGGNALYGQDGDIYIYSAGQVVTESGTVIDATGGYGPDAGLLTIVAEGADIDGGVSAVDLSSTIYAEQVNITSNNGSVNLRAGTIEVDETITITSALDVLSGSGSVIDGRGDGYNADIHIYADGDVDLAGDLLGDRIGIQADGDVTLRGTAYLDSRYYYYGSGTTAGIAIGAGQNLTIESGASVIASEDVQLTTNSPGGTLGVGGYVTGYNVNLDAAGSIDISGEIYGYNQVAISADYTDGPADGDITISGEVRGPGGVSIINRNNGDVVLQDGALITTYYEYYYGEGGLDQGAKVAPGGETALLGLDGDIYIYSAGSVVTVAGSTIDATVGAGSDAGLVTIVANGADAGGFADQAAVDLSGDILAYTVDVTANNGSIHLRDGLIEFSDRLEFNAAQHLYQDAASTLQATDDFAEAVMYADGNITLDGVIDGYTLYVESTGSAVAGGSLIEIGGDISMTDNIRISNEYGGINIAAGADLYAGVPVEYSDPWIELDANGTISSEAGSLMHTAASEDGYVDIYSTAGSGLGVDLAGDITTSDVYISTSGSDVQITDGTITAADNVYVDSYGGVNITGGSIDADETAYFLARGDMLLGGDIEANDIEARISVLAPDESELTIDGALRAYDYIEIENAVGDVVVGAYGSLYGNLNDTINQLVPAIILDGERVVTEAGSQISTPDHGQVDIRVSDTTGTAIDLGGDMDVGILNARTYGDADIVIGGHIDAYDDIHINSGGALTTEEGSLLEAGDLIRLQSDRDMTLGGDARAGAYFVAAIYGGESGAVDESVIRVDGDIYAGLSVLIDNQVGDVEIGGGSEIRGMASGFGYQEYQSYDVEIHGENILTEAGSLITVGPVGGPRDGTVYLHTYDEYGATQLMDLSGDIYTENVVFNVEDGSMRVRAGTTDALGGIDIDLTGYLQVDAGAAFISGGDFDADTQGGMIVNGDVTAQRILLFDSSNTDLVVGGQLLADQDVAINSLNDDVRIGGDALIVADADDYTGSEDYNGLFIQAAGQVTSAAGSVLRAGPAGDPTGNVSISITGLDGGGYSSIDLSSDIDAENLYLTSSAGSIRLRDGDIFVENDLAIDSTRAFVMDAPATITALNDVDITADETLTVAGSITSGGDIALLRDDASTAALTVNGSLQADGAVSIVNQGPGDVVLGGAQILADADSVGGDGSVFISSEGSVIGTGGGQIAVGDPDATGDVTIIADGADTADNRAIDLDLGIVAQDLTLTATAGSIRLDGQDVVLDGDFTATAELDFIFGETVLMQANDVDVTAGRNIDLDGGIQATGEVAMLISGGPGGGFDIDGYIRTTEGITLENTSTANNSIDGLLNADSDNNGAEQILIDVESKLFTGVYSNIYTGDGEGGVSYGTVAIYANGTDGEGGLAINLSGDITTHALTLGAPNGSIRLADGTITVDAALTIGSDFDVLMDAPAVIDAGSFVTMTAGRTLVVDGTVDAGADVTLSVTGGNGDLSIGGSVTSEGDIGVYNNGGGDILIDGDLTGGGGDSDGIYVYGHGRIVTGADSLISLGGEGGPSGEVVLYTTAYDGEGTAAIELSGDISADYVTVEAYEGSIHMTPTAFIRADESAQLIAYHYFVMEEGASIWGAADRAIPDAGGAWPVLPAVEPGVLIVARDVEIDGQVQSGHSQDPGTIIITAMYAEGDITVGGEDNDLGDGFTLSNDEFQNLNADRVVVTAGVGEPFGETYDLHIADLDLDAEQVGEVWFGTGQNIFVEGTVQGEGVDLFLGFTVLVSGPIDEGDKVGSPTAALEPGETLVNFVPENVFITGSLGTVDNPLGSVTMIAQGDVLMGSAAFIEAAAEDPDFNAYEQSPDLDQPVGHVFVAAEQLQIAAMGRVLQQNTAEGSGFGGLVIGMPGEGSELIFAPDAIQGDQVGGTNGFLADFASGPTRVELFGTFINGTGQISGPDAALVAHLLDPDIALGDYFINNCLFGSVCEVEHETPDIPRFEDPIPPVHDDPPGGVIGDELLTFFTAFPFEEPEEEEEEEEVQGEPVTGSGNEDLWPVKSKGAR